jgi:pyruvate dehydrogenase E2 component (dihydrolipoamide acetyltransferase)
MEVEVFDAGTILKILVDEGDAVPLGKVMAVIGEEGEDISDITGGEAESEVEDKAEDKAEDKDKAEGEEKDEVEEEEDKDKDEEEDKVEGENKVEDEEGKDKEKQEAEKQEGKSEKQEAEKKSSSDSTDDRIKASPLARKMAEEQGIELSNVQGTGPEGRIIKKDIENYTPAQSGGVSREDQEHRVSQMRKTIARRLAESKYNSPHYYETIDIDVENLFDARKQMNEMIEGKISFNDIIMKACATALRRHPLVNSSWQEDTILEHGDVNVAFAVAIDEGLITPVIEHTDQKGLQQISSESKELAEQARNRELEPEQMEGSTFTISNLGMFGIEQFTAIINPPNACILAVGAIRDEPVVEDGMVVPGKRMKVTLSSDHRIVDGATAAQFLNTLQSMLQNPLGMLL